MNNTNDNIEKTCNFYMSDWHFTVMVLPYINSEINQNTQIINIFEKDISQKVKTLVDKLNLKNKNEILKINWKSTNINNSINEIESKLKNCSQNLLIINGTNNYIKKVNDEIQSKISKDYFKNRKIKIIDCYDFDTNKENMNIILEKYDYILNTSGEIKISNIMYQ